MKSKYLSSWAFALQRVAQKLWSVDFLMKLNYLCIMETITNTWVLNQRTRHASAPFVSAQIVMGPTILRATRIYRRRSVMYYYFNLIPWCQFKEMDQRHEMSFLILNREVKRMFFCLNRMKVWRPFGNKPYPNFPSVSPHPHPRHPREF